MQNGVGLQRVGRRQSLVKPDRFISCWCEGWHNRVLRGDFKSISEQNTLTVIGKA